MNELECLSLMKLFIHMNKTEGKVHWELDVRNEHVHVYEMIKRAEKLYMG